MVPRPDLLLSSPCSGHQESYFGDEDKHCARPDQNVGLRRCIDKVTSTLSL
jgi:hypothetical protein